MYLNIQRKKNTTVWARTLAAKLGVGLLSVACDADVQNVDRPGMKIDDSTAMQLPNASGMETSSDITDITDNAAIPVDPIVPVTTPQFLSRNEDDGRKLRFKQALPIQINLNEDQEEFRLSIQIEKLAAGISNLNVNATVENPNLVTLSVSEYDRIEKKLELFLVVAPQQSGTTKVDLKFMNEQEVLHEHQINVLVGSVNDLPTITGNLVLNAELGGIATALDMASLMSAFTVTDTDSTNVGLCVFAVTDGSLSVDHAVPALCSSKSKLDASSILRWMPLSSHNVGAEVVGFQVKAFDGEAFSSESGDVKFKIFGAPEIIQVSSNRTTTPVADTKDQLFKVDWTWSAPAITGKTVQSYFLEKSHDAIVWNSVAIISASLPRSYSVTNLPRYSGMYFRLRALLNTNNFTASAPIRLVQGQRIFVTSRADFAPRNLGYVSGADNECRKLSTAAGLGDDWKALISDNTADAVARTKIPAGSRIYNMQDEFVATGSSGLQGGNFLSSIAFDEQKRKIESGAADRFALTFSTNNLTSPGFYCGGYNDPAVEGNVFLSDPTVFDRGASDKLWIAPTNPFLGRCELAQYRLVCVSGQTIEPDFPRPLFTNAAVVVPWIGKTILARWIDYAFDEQGYQLQTSRDTQLSTAVPSANSWRDAVNSNANTSNAVLGPFAGDANEGTDIFYSLRLRSFRKDLVSVWRTSNHRARVVPASHFVFISSKVFNGNFGGVSGANEKCMADAKASRFPGVWKALISTTSQEARSLEIRGSVYNLCPSNTAGCPQEIATNANIWSSSLVAPVKYGSSYTVSSGSVWTGTNANGSASSQNCRDWTSASNLDFATTGNTQSSGPEWIQNPTPNACNGMLRIYCIYSGP